MEKLPDDFINQMRDLLKEDGLKDYLKSFENNSVKGLRVNLDKISLQDFLKVYDEKDLKPITYFDNSFYSNKEKIGNNILHQIGCYYSQEPSSMVPVSLLTSYNLKDAKVLDLCASPGGKSLQISTLVGENGLIVSNEIVHSRARILQSNIERLGKRNFIVLNDTPLNIANNLYGVFDVVIVDAPCSGEGMFRKDKNSIKEWSKEGVQSNAFRQRQIIECADKCLKSGGLLLYSTCTYSKIENEDNVEYIESLGYEVLPVNDKVKSVAKISMFKENTCRCFPCYMKGEGQFCALLRKKRDSAEYKNNKKISYLNSKIAEQFIKDNMNIDFDYNLEMVGNYICIAPKNNINTSGLKVMLKGVILGELVKNRLEPHHQLFSSMGKYFKIKLELKDDENSLKKYLKGEQLSFDKPNGYGVISYYGAYVGGFKSVNGDLKNLYPKGLRIDIK